MNENIKDLFLKADRSISAAERLFNEGDYDFSASRAYYSMFYVAEAALLAVDKTYSSHSALLSGFFENFVKTGLVTKEYHKMLHRAYLLRQEGDYICAQPFPKKSAEELLTDCKKFITEVKKLCTKS